MRGNIQNRIPNQATCEKSKQLAANEIGSPTECMYIETEHARTKKCIRSLEQMSGFLHLRSLKSFPSAVPASDVDSSSVSGSNPRRRADSKRHIDVGSRGRTSDKSCRAAHTTRYWRRASHGAPGSRNSAVCLTEQKPARLLAA